MDQAGLLPLVTVRSALCDPKKPQRDSDNPRWVLEALARPRSLALRVARLFDLPGFGPGSAPRQPCEAAQRVTVSPPAAFRGGQPRDCERRDEARNGSAGVPVQRPQVDRPDVKPRNACRDYAPMVG